MAVLIHNKIRITYEVLIGSRQLGPLRGRSLPGGSFPRDSIIHDLDYKPVGFVNLQDQWCTKIFLAKHIPKYFIDYTVV